VVVVGLIVPLPPPPVPPPLLPSDNKLSLMSGGRNKMYRIINTVIIAMNAAALLDDWPLRIDFTLNNFV
jgi:hypothetical protein